jgi:Leucine Rich repeat
VLSSFPQLGHVSIRCRQVTDAGMTHLQALTNLHHLDLSGTQVGDAGLERLKPLSNLQILNLRHTPVTDNGLTHLETLKRLEVLNLSQTSISGEGLGHLRALKTLRSLDLSLTGGDGQRPGSDSRDGRSSETQAERLEGNRCRRQQAPGGAAEAAGYPLGGCAAIGGAGTGGGERGVAIRLRSRAHQSLTVQVLNALRLTLPSMKVSSMVSAGMRLVRSCSE